MDFTPIVLGIIIIILGCMNMSGNISTLHSYHVKRVKEEDKAIFGKFVGIGTIIIGISLIIASLFALSEMMMIVGLIIGLIPILYAMFKYNKGIF